MKNLIITLLNKLVRVFGVSLVAKQDTLMTYQHEYSDDSYNKPREIQIKNANGININMDFSVFKGGWSYMAEEMKNAVSLLPEQDNLNVLEFGCGDSSIKLFNLLSNKWNVEYKAFESNKKFNVNHIGIHCFIYDENKIENLNIGNKKYDFILIDGPNGVLRKFWYSKIINNVQSGTIILIDDWCHYEEFETALINDFGSVIKYEVIETRKEYDPNSAPHLGYKSWKIVKVI